MTTAEVEFIGMVSESSAGAFSRTNFMQALCAYDADRYHKLRNMDVRDSLPIINELADEVGYRRATGSDEVASHLAGLTGAIKAALDARKTVVIAGYFGEEFKGETMLEAIEDAGAIGVHIDDGKLCIYGNDKGGSARLTKEQAQQMVAELQALIDTL
jgi:hypothetical protein